MDREIAEAIDRFMTLETQRLGAGAALGVTRDGAVLHGRGYGWANIEWRARADIDTVFALASLTKPVTALAIVQLAHAGALSLEDPIAKHLKQVPPESARVTIRHLLTHTSGLPSFTTSSAFHFTKAHRPAARGEALMQACTDAPSSEPGARYLYSNSNYVLLAHIIEGVTGARFGEYLNEAIFVPAGMNETRVLHERAVIPKRAAGYQLSTRGIANAETLSPTWLSGAGALGSTVRDLVRLDDALRRDALLPRAAFQAMLAPARLSDGALYPYGLGWGLAAYHGRPAHFHTGGRAGFTAELIRFAEDDVTIILLANHASFPFHRTACAIARAALAIPMAARSPAHGADPSWCGAYRAQDSDALFTISRDGDTLYGDGFPAGALRMDKSGVLYPAEDPEIEIARAGDALTVTVPMFPPTRFRRIEA